MGFYNYINDEQKIRIPLSKRAYIVMNDDMRIFGVSKQANFINTIIENFRDTAKSSLSTYMSKRRDEFEELLKESALDEISKRIAVEHLVKKERETTMLEIEGYLREKYVSKLYHINNRNYEYLISEECKEEEFYHYKAGTYIKCLLEEYACLPFIKRERIFKRDVYEAVEYACKTRTLLQIKTQVYGEKQTFLVYPYKIMSDPLGTQEYLTCFTRRSDQSPKEKDDASFAMARLEKPIILKQEAFISKADIEKIEEDISKLSAVYLLGKPQEIRVRLTERGKKSYQTRLYARPDKDETLSKGDEYVFLCSEQQAYYYFFLFGTEAEIIAPESLRNRMKRNYENAWKLYE